MSTLENRICQQTTNNIYEECAQAEWQIARWDEICGTLKTDEVNPKTGKPRRKRRGATTVPLRDFARSITTRNACFSAPNIDIDRLRALPKDERDRIKVQSVYAYCVANRNPTHSEMSTLEGRDLNDLVCLDFDCDCDGNHLTPETAPIIRDICAHSPACVFSALSLSGAGAFAVMRVYGGFWADILHNGADYRKARMTALFDLIRRELGVQAVCDDACKDATRLRAASFDAQAFYNPGCDRCISKAAIDAEILRLNAPLTAPNPSNTPTISEADRAYGDAQAQTAREAERVSLLSQQRVTICASKAKALEALAKLATLKRNSGAGVHAKVYGTALNLYERCFIAADFDVTEIEAMVIEACKQNGEYQERPEDVLTSIRDAKKEAELKCAAKRAQAKAKAERAQAQANAEQQFLASYWERLRYDTFADDYLDEETGEHHNIDYVGAWIARDLEAYTGKRVNTSSAVDMVFKYVRQVKERCFDGLLERAQELAREGESGAIDAYCSKCGFDAYETKRLRLWLYQLAARAFIPGEKTDNILIFASRLQGIGKTWFCDMISRALCGQGAFEYRKEAGKDARIMMSRASVARLDEVDVWTRKTDLAALKALMTETQSIERAPYAHASEQRLYRAVLVGTTNKEDIIPEGEEMARRYWIIKPRKNMWIDLTTARALVSEACADVMACISAEGYDAYNGACKIWLENAQEIEENTRRNAHHKDAGNATFAILHGVSMIRALAGNAMDLGEFGSKGIANLDDTRCLGAKDWAIIFTTGEVVALSGNTERFTPIRAGVKEVSSLITQRVKRTKDKQRNSGYCLRDIEAAFRDAVQEEGVNDDQEVVEEATTPKQADKCYDTPYSAQVKPGYGMVKSASSDEYDDGIPFPPTFSSCK